MLNWSKIKISIADRIGTSNWVSFHMAQSGEKPGNFFTRISTWMQWPNTYLFKDGRSVVLCTDYLLHPTISTNTLDSKPSSYLLSYSRHLLNESETSTFAATAMKISYGIEIQESDDAYISVADESLAGFNEAAVLGTFWVDFFPFLKYVPSWFPGGGFQKKAAHWRELNASLTEKPFSYTKEQLVGDRVFRAKNS